MLPTILLTLTLGAAMLSIKPSTFPQYMSIDITGTNGHIHDSIQSIAVSGNTVWAASEHGLVTLDNTANIASKWKTVDSLKAMHLCSDGSGGVIAASDKGFFKIDSGGKPSALDGLVQEKGVWVERASKGGYWCLTSQNLIRWHSGVMETYSASDDMLMDYFTEDGRGRVFVGARLRTGAYSSGERGTKISYIRRLLRLEGNKLVSVSGIKNSFGRSVSDELLCAAADKPGHVWIGTPNGILITDGANFWDSMDGREGMPYVETNCITMEKDGTLWTGSSEGVCRMQGGKWSYFRGRRWLPNDDVHSIAPDGSGGAWVATSGGAAHIVAKPINLQDKAAHYEDITLMRHNRNGYVTICNLKDPDDLSSFQVEASDNDGLWSSVYAAGECFRYAATKDPDARALAQKSMTAIQDLEKFSGIPGYPARAIVRDGEKSVFLLQGSWHRSKVDPAVQWKGNTSSDELDGHYFIYPIYYDLVADETEKQSLVSSIRRITDHLLAHNYQLYDIDGKPTRWAIFNPENLNDNPGWEEERGLNSLSILAYLKATYHMTGDQKYQDAYENLVQKHHYLLNVLHLKQLPPYSINHSDDQLTFLGYYTLLRYETNPEYRRLLLLSLDRTWQIVRPLRSPLFNYIYGALTEKACAADEAAQTLMEWPWDLRHWNVKNSHRSDIQIGASASPGILESTRALPYSELRSMQWSDNPFALDSGEDGKREYDGAAFLLPYWLGRYWKLIPGEN